MKNLVRNPGIPSTAFTLVMALTIYLVTRPSTLSLMGHAFLYALILIVVLLVLAKLVQKMLKKTIELNVLVIVGGLILICVICIGIGAAFFTGVTWPKHWHLPGWTWTGLLAWLFIFAAFVVATALCEKNRKLAYRAGRRRR